MKKLLLITMGIFLLNGCKDDADELPETKIDGWYNNRDLVVAVKLKCEADPDLNLRNKNCRIAIQKFHSSGSRKSPL